MRHFFMLCVLLLTASIYASHKPLVVHEWGTFTSLQDETGRSIGYLNSSVEPLPGFVHRLRSGLLYNEPINLYSKGIGGAHPDVTMRLETPVIYFHPADKTAEPFNVDVSATFKGGVLSEFYPNAKFHIEGGNPAPAGLDHISGKTAGSLMWKSLRVGEEVKIPETKEHVWLAPRQVDSAPVAMGSEGERYVFYRGVGKVEAPLKITRGGDEIAIHNSDGMKSQPPMWFAEFKADGICAYRTITGQDKTAGSFTPADFSKDRAIELRKEMRVALISDGLYDDEADAMLNTWERSYFQGVGQRVFFLVPRAWTDQVLPLTISAPNELTRVMIGRIELITPAQKDVLAQLPAHPKGMEKLGRFGYAMVLDELKRTHDPELAKFAKSQGIQERTVSTTQPAPAAVSAAAR